MYIKQPAFKLKLSRSQKRLLFTLALAIVLSLTGVGYTNSEQLGTFLKRTQPGNYEVVRVDDGDTITVEMSGKEERVRLIGVDTPELHHPKKPVQCFAEAARQFTTNLIGTNRVRLEADPEDDNRDLYQRLLRYVYLPDGTLVNTEIVRSGHGFAYTYFPFTKLEEMRTLEREARQQQRGLWAGCSIEQADNGNQETNPL